MRLLKSNPNKENIDYPLKNQEKQKVQDLRLELKHAYAEIAALKDRTLQLINKLEHSEKELQQKHLLQEEIQFMKEQQWNTKQQLVNLQDINNKLRHQLEKMEQENESLKKQMMYSMNIQKEVMERKQTRRPSLDEEIIPQNSRNNERSFRASSCMSDRQRSNHCSTPKTKMSIKYEDLMPSQPQVKRRVFL